MNRSIRLASMALLTILAISCEDLPVSDYDLVWDTPSLDSSGSMPIGNGEVGGNVWVEPDGDLVWIMGAACC